MDNTYVWDLVLQQRYKELRCAADTERLLREVKASQQKEQASKLPAIGKRDWPRMPFSVKLGIYSAVYDRINRTFRKSSNKNPCESCLQEC